MSFDDSTTDATGPALAQVAISCRDAARTQAWYVDGLGFLPAGEINPTADLSSVQGVPGAQVASVKWLLDGNDFFQLELFEYSAPEVRPPPEGAGPCDIGYRRLGIWVDGFDQALAALADLGTRPSKPTAGEPGRRRAAVVDPDGVQVELLEHDDHPAGAPQPARPDLGVAVRSVTASVPDLDRATAYFSGALGMPIEPRLLPGDLDELWGLATARSVRRTLTAGAIRLELVQYLHPQPRPFPPGYRISDAGILNIALGRRTREGFLNMRDAAAASGYRLHQPVNRELMSIQYVEDADGFSVEMAYFDRRADFSNGFAMSGM